MLGAALLLAALGCPGKQAAPAADPSAPLHAVGYQATLFARALDVSCAPAGAQPGVQGCLALVRYQGALSGVDVPPSSPGYGSIAFVRTDASGAVTWVKALMAGFDPISSESGAFVDDDLRVQLLATGEFLVSGTYEGRVFIGTPGGNNQELGGAPDRRLFLIEFHPDGTFDNWEDPGKGREQHALAVAELPSTDLVIAGSCQGDVPLDSGSFACGASTSGYLLTVHYDCSTVGGLSFGGSLPAEASDVVADAAGNLYVSGSFEEQMTLGSLPPDLAAGEDDAFVMKLRPDGSRAFFTTAASLGHDRGGRLALVKGGVLWTARVSEGARVGPTLLDQGGQVVALLDEAGAVQWVKRVPQAGAGTPLRLAAAADGSFVLFGDGFLGRYLPDGTEAWVRTGADVRGAAFTGSALVVAASSVGGSVLGATIAAPGDHDLRAALVFFAP